MPATLENRFPFIIAEMRPKISAAVKAGAEEVAVLAAAKAPVARGRLRDSIHVENVGTATYSVVAGDDDVFYGHFQEYGTVHDPPQPFLIPAAEELTPEVIGLVTAVLREL